MGFSQTISPIIRGQRLLICLLFYCLGAGHHHLLGLLKQHTVSQQHTAMSLRLGFDVKRQYSGYLNSDHNLQTAAALQDDVNSKVKYDSTTATIGQRAQGASSLASVVAGQSGQHASPPLPSAAWQPMVIKTCEQGMPGQYAPCLAKEFHLTNLQFAEEVIYPDFAIRAPWYVQAQHADIVEQHLQVRFRKEKRSSAGTNWFYYLNQHGRNLIFSNATYNPGKPPASWTSDGSHCMGGKPAQLRQFAQPNVNLNSLRSKVHPSVMFAASPDSYSFQHWSDRTAMMLVQAEHHRQNITEYIAMNPRDNSVAEGWRLLGKVGDPGAQLISPGDVVHAQTLIFSCDTPLIHPYLMLRSSEAMLAAAGLDPRGKPLEDRKVVVLATRMNDQHIVNGGRRWLNYKTCLPQIEQLLHSRKQGERLEEWDMSRFDNHAKLMRYWSSEVRAVIGMHGGALYNVQYATAPTLVMEIWPVSQDGRHAAVPTPNVIWEISSTKGLQHWTLPVNIANGTSSDVVVDCQLVVTTLQQHLGKDYGNVVEPFYQGTTWSA